MSSFAEILGKTLVSIEGAEKGSERITFKFSDDSEYAQFHIQDCCESVLVEDIAGDISSLIGLPLLMAEESTNSDFNEVYYESSTWTFYKLASSRGYVTIRWIGTSNGYYSESVEFEKLS